MAVKPKPPEGTVEVDTAFPFGDTNRDTIIMKFSKAYDDQRVTFHAGPVVRQLLRLDTDVATLQATGKTREGLVEYACRRLTALTLCHVVGHAINRRCMYAEDYLKAPQVKALEEFEKELRSRSRAKGSHPTEEVPNA